MSPEHPDLVLRDVRYVVDRPLLDDVTLTFPAGLVTALSGPSGSGKTTLLSIAGGLLEPTSGAATYDGTPTWRGTGDPRPEMAFVLQVYGLVPILSARENVAVALRARGVAPREADERATEALARFHIGDLGDRQVEELSGGQMQRVALARGLAVGARVLLADEPTSELDEANRGLVMAELRREAERGAVVVVATHDQAVVDACDRHVALDEGRLVDPATEHLSGSAEEPPAAPVAPAAPPAPVAPAPAVTSAPTTPAAPVTPAPPRHAAPAAVEPEPQPEPQPPAPAPSSTGDDPHAAFRRPR